jgi:signal peptidase II
MLVRQDKQGYLPGLSFGLILGGAVGNLIDRVRHGWVVDFLHLWIRTGDRVRSWPDFNVADSAIVVGTALLILFEFGIHRGTSGKKEDAPHTA